MKSSKYGIHHMQKKTKRVIASAACALGVLAVCLGVIGYRNNIHAEEEVVTEHRVINTLAQIPETKKQMYDNNESSYELGTKENPFLLLEIVPYEEYAEFGYHISGCEPIDIDRVPSVNLNEYVNSLNTATVKQQQRTYFFKDEPEVSSGRCKNDQGVLDIQQVTSADRDSNGYAGYYEKVEEGKGCFVQNEDGTFVKQENGDIIWHTFCQYEKDEVYKDVSVEGADSQHALLTKTGDRVYTMRLSTDEDPVVMTNSYYYYKNNDNFLKTTLKLNDEQAKDYWISVKTITPRELDQDTKWAEYADMYIISNKAHVGVLPKGWKLYNRFGHKVTEGAHVDTFENTSGDSYRDITWAVARKMYDKITAETNYAALVVDDRVYTENSGIVNSKKGDKQLYAYDMNLNKTSQKYNTQMRSNNNIFKLMVMLFSMDSEWFKPIFLNESHPLIDDQGNFLLQEDKEDQEYWSMYSFMLLDPTTSKPIWTYLADQDKELWYKYGYMGNMTSSDWKNAVKGRVFAFSGDRATVQDYLSDSNNNLDTSKDGYLFTDFKKFMEDESKEDPNADEKASSSDVVRYILGQNSKYPEKITGNLKILDLEPCYDSKDGWKLKENYFRLLIPNFYGDVSVDHMTTAEFIGSSVDLNCTYDMIYMGLEDGAYNLKSQSIAIPGKKDEEGNEVKEKDTFTVFNDFKMNGLIYFHVGDKMNAHEYVRNQDGYVEDRSVKFLYEGENDTTLRFPGNDITRLKKNALEKFLESGNFIVAVPYLYDTDPIRIDPSSNICKFIKEQKSAKAAVYKTTDSKSIYEKVKNVKPSVTFSVLPQKFESTVIAPKNTDTATIENVQYLERDSKDRPQLPFSFYLKDTGGHGYKCRVYIDQNQDGKFDSSEIFYNAKKTYYSSSKEQSIKTVTLSKNYFGIVNWKVEVYQEGNPEVYFTESGCSAVDKLGEIGETSVRVLQILPANASDSRYGGWLNLTSGEGDGLNAEGNKNKLFTKYYDALSSAYNYKIHVTAMSLNDFLTKFDENQSGGPFRYDYSQPISESNPSKMSSQVKELFDSYDMMIIGFGDTYYKRDLKNDKGAVDFIKYFVAQGKSVLFTHDLTSMHNVDSRDFGYTANALLRDVMGMNRYGAISNQLANDGVVGETENQYDKMKKYQEANASKYESLTYYDGTSEKTYPQKQGFTYYAMKRLGWRMETKIGANMQEVYSNDALQVMPYHYMIYQSKYPDQHIYQINGYEGNANGTGFSDTNDLTTVAEKTAEGQITEYPFKIDDSLNIASTHGQWYQLNMEDPNLTVWYCLGDESDDKKVWTLYDATSKSAGTSGTYGVSPKDAANNYYIYSKGNVFYSGVGHSTVTDDMEARLFINTMIAAYHASNRPPMVELLNEEATLTKWDMTASKAEYDMTSTEEYVKKSSTTSTVDNSNEGSGTDDDKYIKIRFSPLELAVSSIGMKCSIYYGDKEPYQYVKTIYHVVDTTDDGREEVEELHADSNGVFDSDINNMDEYYFYYPRAYLDSWKDTNGKIHSPQTKITFKIQNNKNKEDEYGLTTVDLSTKLLFMLD